jgi:hypothetical protein
MRVGRQESGVDGERGGNNARDSEHHAQDSRICWGLVLVGELMVDGGQACGLSKVWLVPARS